MITARTTIEFFDRLLPWRLRSCPVMVHVQPDRVAAVRQFLPSSLVTSIWARSLFWVYEIMKCQAPGALHGASARRVIFGMPARFWRLLAPQEDAAARWLR